MHAFPYFSWLCSCTRLTKALPTVNTHTSTHTAPHKNRWMTGRNLLSLVG